ncbi:uncharacterized protein [Ptychodera flava]|uniref:uncharacterized protein n=1 Tax=Ptychodera flava TaxID=63121 RepID=UPI00396A5698
MSECVLAGKTRAKTTCTGNLCHLTVELRRCCQSPGDLICLHHLKAVIRRNRRLCSCPAPWAYSDKICERPIPSRLFQVFDEIGAKDEQYVPGTRWCTRCKSKADLEFFPGFSQYLPPKKIAGGNIGNSNIRDRSPLQPTIFNKTDSVYCGTVLSTNEGHVLLSKTQWNGIISKLQGSTFSEQLKTLQEMLYRSQQNGVFLDVKKMEYFAKKYVPDLYQEIYRAIVDPSLSVERKRQQEKRILTVLSLLAYYRSQKTRGFQEAMGIYFNMQGLSQEAQDMCHIFGLSQHPRTLLKRRQQIAGEHGKRIKTYLMNKLQSRGKAFILALIDDFHNIHGFKSMASGHKELKTSQAVHMATTMLDILPVESLDLPAGESIHRNIFIYKNGQQILVRGGIAPHVMRKEFKLFMQDYALSFLESLPIQYHQLDTQHAISSLKNMRPYTDVDVEELHTLNTTVLVDEIEQPLKRKQDLLKLWMMLLDIPQLKTYTSKQAILAPGDWPVWYFGKKIIASFSDNDISIPTEILSFVPTVGQFHITLNASRDIVISARFFFQLLCNGVFDKRFILAKSPKPYKVSLCIYLAFSGWIRIRRYVISKLTMCKSVEVQFMLYLLDELIPLVYFHYPVFVQGKDRNMLLKVLKRLEIYFIISNRHHYNKSLLSLLSDDLYHSSHLPGYNHLTQNHQHIITEKKVELFHSSLRHHIQPHDDGITIQRQAHMLHHTKHNTLIRDFLQHHNHGKDDHDLTLLAGRSAETLLDIINQVMQSAAEHEQHTEVNSTTYHLPTFNTDITAKCLPLGFRWSDHHRPSEDLICDSPNCSISSSLFNLSKRLTCGHTFHITCLSQSGCPICSPLLTAEVVHLSNSWNESIIKDIHSQPSNESTETTDSDTLPTSCKIHDMQYYLTQQFEDDIKNRASLIPNAQTGQFRNKQHKEMNAHTTQSNISSPSTNTSAQQTQTSHSSSINASILPTQISQPSATDEAIPQTHTTRSSEDGAVLPQTQISPSSTNDAAIPQTQTANLPSPSDSALPHIQTSHSRHHVPPDAAILQTETTLSSIPVQQHSVSDKQIKQKQNRKSMSQSSLQLHKYAHLRHLVCLCPKPQSHGCVSYWSCNNVISQGSLHSNNMRSGSNACTLICLLFAQWYYQECSIQILPESSVFPQECLVGFIMSCVLGNQAHDIYRLNELSPHLNLSPLEGMRLLGNKLKLSFHSNEIGPVYTHHMSEPRQGLLEFYLDYCKQRAKMALVYVRRNMSILFIVNQGHVLLADSHTHSGGQNGALFAQVQHSNVKYLHQFYDSFIGVDGEHNIGTVTLFKF